MNREICIHAWSCSYFINNEKQWVPGKLSLTPRCLKFTADKTGEILVSFHLSCISEIKKESSTFIFSSITILEKGLAKHWFSSLYPNRNVVFNVLEHFWREELLSPHGTGTATSASQSTKGKQLVDLVSDSEKRLEDTARVLHHQGEQFDNIIKGLDKIESQMDVADRMLTQLESPAWWPFSAQSKKASSDVKAQETASSASSTAPGIEGLILKIPVVFTNKKDSNLQQGNLSVFVSALEISDLRNHVVHRYEREDVDDIKVVTPYEIIVRHRFIGKPDIYHRILSAKMHDAISILELQYKKKMELLEGALLFTGGNKSPQADEGTSGSFWHSGQLPNLLDKAVGFIDGIVQSGNSPDGGAQAQVQVQTVTEEETQELRQVLRKMKTLALDTETELQKQGEALEVISSSTDRATLTIDKQNHRMRKLL
ncbi:synaptosomal-associated protein 47 [Ambystoma mexicanum]|uniref:synaptosomal-associated protein 47 n=1 Tax=Ambystoma mexicanum TaxID=8296 RepID=UPI0037E820E0